MPERDFSWKTIPTADYELLVSAREALFQVGLVLDRSEWSLADLQGALGVIKDHFAMTTGLPISSLPTPRLPSQPTP